MLDIGQLGHVGGAGGAQHLGVSTQGAVGVVTLARPAKRNAICGAMIREIGALFADPPAAWRAAVLAAEGDHFSAGLDLAEHRERAPEEVMAISRLWHRATQAVRAGRLPVVAALQGSVIGAGLELAAVAHVRVADPDARFSLPEARRRRKCRGAPRCASAASSVRAGSRR